MTYRNLLKKLQEVVDSRLDDEVTIQDKSSDEFYPALTIKEAKEDTCDVLDEGHLYLTIETGEIEDI